MYKFMSSDAAEFHRDEIAKRDVHIAVLECELRGAQQALLQIANSGVDEKGRDIDTMTIGDARSIALVALGITW